MRLWDKLTPLTIALLFLLLAPLPGKAAGLVLCDAAAGNCGSVDKTTADRISKMNSTSLLNAVQSEFGRAQQFAHSYVSLTAAISEDQLTCCYEPGWKARINQCLGSAGTPQEYISATSSCLNSVDIPAKVRSSLQGWLNSLQSASLYIAVAKIPANQIKSDGLVEQLSNTAASTRLTLVQAPTSVVSSAVGEVTALPTAGSAAIQGPAPPQSSNPQAQGFRNRNGGVNGTVGGSGTSSEQKKVWGIRPEYVTPPLADIDCDLRGDFGCQNSNGGKNPAAPKAPESLRKSVDVAACELEVDAAKFAVGIQGIGYIRQAARVFRSKPAFSAALDELVAACQPKPTACGEGDLRSGLLDWVTAAKAQFPQDSNTPTEAKARKTEAMTAALRLAHLEEETRVLEQDFDPSSSGKTFWEEAGLPGSQTVFALVHFNREALRIAGSQRVCAARNTALLTPSQALSSPSDESFSTADGYLKGRGEYPQSSGWAARCILKGAIKERNLKESHELLAKYPELAALSRVHPERSLFQELYVESDAKKKEVLYDEALQQENAADGPLASIRKSVKQSCADPSSAGRAVIAEPTLRRAFFNCDSSPQPALQASCKNIRASKPAACELLRSVENIENAKFFGKTMLSAGMMALDTAGVAGGATAVVGGLARGALVKEMVGRVLTFGAQEAIGVGVGAGLSVYDYKQTQQEADDQTWKFYGGYGDAKAYLASQQTKNAVVQRAVGNLVVGHLAGQAFSPGHAPPEFSLVGSGALAKKYQAIVAMEEIPLRNHKLNEFIKRDLREAIGKKLGLSPVESLSLSDHTILDLARLSDGLKRDGEMGQLNRLFEQCYGNHDCIKRIQDQWIGANEVAQVKPLAQPHAASAISAPASQSLVETEFRRLLAIQTEVEKTYSQVPKKPKSTSMVSGQSAEHWAEKITPEIRAGEGSTPVPTHKLGGGVSSADIIAVTIDSKDYVARAVSGNIDSITASRKTIAASQLNQALGLNTVPRSRLAWVNGKKVVLSDWAKGGVGIGFNKEEIIKSAQNNLPGISEKTIRDVEAFEFLVGNGDVHATNFTYDSKGGTVQVFDHNMALSYDSLPEMIPEPLIPTMAKMTKGYNFGQQLPGKYAESFVHQLENMGQKNGQMGHLSAENARATARNFLKAQVGSYLSSDEIEGILIRREMMLEDIKQRGPSAILTGQ
ncbi:hypothetical protein WDW37_17440 [Bdellovibrionota bacterium FG-1]